MGLPTLALALCLVLAASLSTGGEALPQQQQPPQSPSDTGLIPASGEKHAVQRQQPDSNAADAQKSQTDGGSAVQGERQRRGRKGRRRNRKGRRGGEGAAGKRNRCRTPECKKERRLRRKQRREQRRERRRQQRRNGRGKGKGKKGGRDGKRRRKDRNRQPQPDESLQSAPQLPAAPMPVR